METEIEIIGDIGDKGDKYKGCGIHNINVNGNYIKISPHTTIDIIKNNMITYTTTNQYSNDIVYYKHDIKNNDKIRISKYEKPIYEYKYKYNIIMRYIIIFSILIIILYIKI